MVAGAVQPPRIDLTNEELVRSHVHAIWLAETGQSMKARLPDWLSMDSLVAWIIPLAACFVFFSLFASANPLIEYRLQQFGRFGRSPATPATIMKSSGSLQTGEGLVFGRGVSTDIWLTIAT